MGSLTGAERLPRDEPTSQRCLRARTIVLFSPSGGVVEGMFSEEASEVCEPLKGSRSVYRRHGRERAVENSISGEKVEYFGSKCLGAGKCISWEECVS